MLRRTFVAASLQALASGHLFAQDTEKNNDNQKKDHDKATASQFAGVPELKCEVKGIGRTRQFFSLTSDFKLMAVQRSERNEGIGGHDTFAIVQETLTGKVVQKFRYVIAPYAQLRCLALSGDGRYLVTGRAEPGLALWDVQTGKRLDNLPSQEPSFYCAAFSHDGKTLIAGTQQGVIQVWDFPKCETRFYRETKTGYIDSLFFSADDRRLAISGSNGGLNVIDLSTEKSIAEIRDGSQVSERSSLSPDGKTIALITSAGETYLWDVDQLATTHVLRESWRHSYDTAISFDGKLVAVTVERLKVGFFEILTGKLIATINLPGRANSSLHRLFFVRGKGFRLIVKNITGELFYLDATDELQTLNQRTALKDL